MKSIFPNKNELPTLENLKIALDETFQLWNQFADFTINNYPEATAEWHFSGEKFGWSYRIKDRKRVIVYLLPRDRFFKVALVFGQKAVDRIANSSISEGVRTELLSAKKYAEGRGIRIEVTDSSNCDAILKLIKIKIMN